MSRNSTTLRRERSSVIQPTGLTNLRLQVFQVHVDQSVRDLNAAIRFSAWLRFPAEDQPGIRRLYRSCEVEGSFSDFAWRRLEAFHGRLTSSVDQDIAGIELVTSHATLEQPRASVSETDSGFAAVAILRICVDDIESARIPGYRWRIFTPSDDCDANVPVSSRENSKLLLH